MQKFFKRASYFRQLVLHPQWRFVEDGAPDNAIRLKLPQMEREHALRCLGINRESSPTA